MSAILRSILTLLVGAALAVYGLIHTITHVPDPSAFSELVQTMPALTAVLVFVLGSLAVVAGVVLLIASSRRLRRQWRQLHQLTSRTREFVNEGPDYDDDDPQRNWRPAYR